MNISYMKTKHIKNSMLAAVFVVAGLFSSSPLLIQSAYAQPAQQSGQLECGKAKTNIIKCDGEGVEAIGDVLKSVLFALTMLIGIVATGGIVYAAVLYASAQDNSGQIGKAKTIIRDIIIGIFIYGFMLAIINWLVPGGVIQ